jgi:hypothetical protein
LESVATLRYVVVVVSGVVMLPISRTRPEPVKPVTATKDASALDADVAADAALVAAAVALAAADVTEVAAAV